MIITILLGLFLLILISSFSFSERRLTHRALYNYQVEMILDEYSESNNYRLNNSYNASNNYMASRNDFADWIRTKIRRRKALKACKPYLTKRGNSIKLKNKNVILSFDTRAKTITCKDRKNLKNSVNVIWSDQPESLRNNIDNPFEETVDALCFSFDKNSQYLKIAEVLSEFFDYVQIKKDNNLKIYSKENNNNKDIKEFIYVDDYIAYMSDSNKLNINSASEKEITNLPGISAIMAKRIIKFRELNGEFDSIAELYSELKIKPHFQKKLNEMIFVGPVVYNKNEVKVENSSLDIFNENTENNTDINYETNTDTEEKPTNSDERIIDF